MRRPALTIAAGIVAFTVAAAPALAATTYEYDELGRLTKVTYDDGSTIEYSYDAAGNRTEVEQDEA